MTIISLQDFKFKNVLNVRLWRELITLYNFLKEKDKALKGYHFRV